VQVVVKLPATSEGHFNKEELSSFGLTEKREVMYSTVGFVAPCNCGVAGLSSKEKQYYALQSLQLHL
jgi:hypothetical protein